VISGASATLVSVIEPDTKGVAMSLSVAIAVTALADVALVGALTLVMSRAKRLTPHSSAGRGD
jgi:hypothetical protein